MQSSTRKPEAARVQRLVERLGEHPAVFERIERILEVVGNESGEAITADEAEELLVQELRRMGRDALRAWAEEREVRLRREYGARAGLVRREKRFCWQTRFGAVEVIEQSWRRGQIRRRRRQSARALWG